MKKISRTKRVVHFIDISYCIVSLITLALWLGLSKIKPNKLFFPENDSNSLFPVKKTSVPFYLVCVIAFGLFNVIFIVLYFLQRKFPEIFKKFSLFTCGWSLLFAVSICNVCVNVAKSYVGRPRPDIISRCEGDPQKNGCSNQTEGKYLDSYKSWPSGHSSTALSSVVFFALFIINCTKRRYVFIDLIACLTVFYGIYVGATRIVEFRHHTDDVLAGFFIGFVFAYFTWNGTKERIFTYDELMSGEIGNSLLNQ